MKSNKFLLNLIITFLTIVSCTYDSSIPLSENPSQRKSSKSEINYPTISTNELIVLFYPGISDNIKQSLRTKYEILSYEKCDCNNERLEKWTFPSGADIEGRKEDLEEEGGVEGTDYQFSYPNENMSLTNGSNNQNIALLSSHVNPKSSDVTIAVLDTGIDLNKLIDPNKPETKKLFLHDSRSSNSSCNDLQNPEISGWNFVNHDNNVFDDHGHGTIVIDILKSKLDHDNYRNYQILPVKVFDHLGEGTTFDILCGYLYAVSKPEVSVINMSFGWYKYPSDLLSKFIKEKQDILHITSSGNDDKNNDDYHHYPSSVPYKNLIAIGSYSILQQNGNKQFIRSSFSNFGYTSVDFLSKGEDVLFYDNSLNVDYFVDGTSFATPKVTAHAIELFLEGTQNPLDIIHELRFNATRLNNGNTLPVYFNDRVIE